MKAILFSRNRIKTYNIILEKGDRIFFYNKQDIISILSYHFYIKTTLRIIKHEKNDKFIVDIFVNDKFLNTIYECDGWKYES